MLRKLFLSASICAVLMGISATASAQNDSPFKDTYFTFSQPVALPNLSLPAGRYLFRVVDGSKSIVQIYAGDRSKLLGTVMSVQAARSDLPEKAEVRLIESSAGNPIAVGTWWYPGQRQGWEFVYPRAQASKLAQTSKEPILTTASNVPADKMDSADLVRLSSSGEQPYSASASPRPVAGTAQVGDTAAADQNANRVAAAMSGQAPAQRPATQPSTPSAQGQVAQSTTPRRDLPATASQTPLLALIGLLSLAAGIGLRLRRSQVL
jgi:LPXTG-motif cell wall-anchored protein